MSAIGDYIHYSAKGYDAHGTSLNGNFTQANYSYQMQKIKSQLAKNAAAASPEELNQFGKMITAFMNNPESLPQGVQAQQILEENLAEKFEKDMSNANLNLESMTVSGLSTENALGKVSSHKSAKGSLYMDLREITNKINKLEEIYLKKFNQKSVNTQEFRALRQIYTDLVGESVKKLKKYNFKDNPKDLKLEGNYSDIGKLRSQLNALIEKYASYPDIVGIEGLAFENAIALTAYAADQEANIAADEALLAVLGEQSTRIEQYNKNFFSKQYIEQLGEDTFLDTKYNQRSKIDVQLKWNEKDFKISAKNVTFKDTHTWIDVVSGSPLLSMIQDIDGDFINHWINIHAVHGTSTYAKSAGKDINNAMKSFIFYKAITGDVYGRALSKTANLFVVNDKTQKNGVIVKDMNSVFIKALENLNKVSVQINGTNINQLKLKNVWSNTDYISRLNSVMNELHALKIEAGFNANAILI